MNRSHPDKNPQSMNHASRFCDAIRVPARSLIKGIQTWTIPPTNTARLFFELYASDAFRTVVELVSQDVNGSIRDHCPAGVHYIGLDMMLAKGVDLVVGPGDPLPRASEAADAVVTSSAFEHDVGFWDTFLELEIEAMPDMRIATDLRSEPAAPSQRNADLSADLATVAQRNMGLSAELAITTQRSVALVADLVDPMQRNTTLASGITTTLIEAVALRQNLNAAEIPVSDLEDALANAKRDLAASRNSPPWWVTAGLCD